MGARQQISFQGYQQANADSPLVFCNFPLDRCCKDSEKLSHLLKRSRVVKAINPPGKSVSPGLKLSCTIPYKSIDSVCCHPEVVHASLIGGGDSTFYPCGRKGQSPSECWKPVEFTAQSLVFNSLSTFFHEVLIFVGGFSLARLDLLPSESGLWNKCHCISVCSGRLPGACSNQNVQLP